MNIQTKCKNYGESGYGTNLDHNKFWNILTWEIVVNSLSRMAFEAILKHINQILISKLAKVSKSVCHFFHRGDLYVNLG